MRQTMILYHQHHTNYNTEENQISHGQNIIDKDIVTDEPIADTQEVYLRIKEKRERHADKVNSQGAIVEFNRGYLVLVNACRVSDAYQKIIAKFCDIFQGPYKVGNKISNFNV